VTYIREKNDYRGSLLHDAKESFMPVG